MGQIAAAPRAGYKVADFCEAVGFCRATYYNLPERLRPKSIKLGKRRIITESPPEYLARLAATQEATDAEAA